MTFLRTAADRFRSLYGDLAQVLALAESVTNRQAVSQRKQGAAISLPRYQGVEPSNTGVWGEPRS